jgi:hypothetical protein
MLTLLRIIIGGTIQCLTGAMNITRAAIEILGAVDTLLSDFGCAYKSGLLDIPLVDVKLPSTWSIMLDTMKKLLCHAYTFNGVGITYSMAREVLEIREKFDHYQSRTKTNLSLSYDSYLKRGCVMDEMSKDDLDLEDTFRRLAKIKCEHATDLIVKRTYEHPVFGHKNGSISLTEMVLDANITLPDIRCIVASKFLGSLCKK